MSEQKLADEKIIQFIYPLSRSIIVGLLNDELLADMAAFHLPYGISILASYLKEHGISSKIVDLQVELMHKKTYLNYFHKTVIWNNPFTHENLTNYFFKGQPNPALEKFGEAQLAHIDYQDYKIFGLSIQSYKNFRMALSLAKAIKLKRPEATIVMGGPYITLIGYRYFEALKGLVDYMVMGNGEEGILQLTKNAMGENVDFKDVSGLVYRDNEEVKINPVKKFNGDHEPAPDFDGLRIEYYQTKNRNGKMVMEIPYRFAQGCVMHCSFCTYPYIDKYTAKSVDRIVSDLEMLVKKYNTNRFLFVDSSLNSAPKLLQEVVQAMIDRNMKLDWSGYMKINNTSEEVLQLMAKAGCYALEWGLEGSSDKMLKIMEKRCNLQESIEVLEKSHRTGITNYVNIILGHPGEGPEDVEKAAGFVIKHLLRENTNWTLNNFLLVVGSKIFRQPEKWGIIKRPIRFDRMMHDDEDCEFDFENGRTFEEHRKLQRQNYKYVLKKIWKYRQELNPHLFFKLIPFGVYYFFKYRNTFDPKWGWIFKQIGLTKFWKKIRD